jgi:hypothetical protein
MTAFLWARLPDIALVWVFFALIQAIRMAHDEFTDRLPVRPMLFFVRECVAQAGGLTIAGLAFGAYERGLISLVPLGVAVIAAVAIGYFVAGKEPASKAERSVNRAV